MATTDADGTTHLRTCPLCEAMCGLELRLGDGPGAPTVDRIRADRDDVWSKGYLCPKGTTLGHLHDDPDRLRAPMVRDRATGEWSEVTWEAAFERCAELLGGVRERYGIEAVTAYLGNPLAHTFGLGRYTGLLIGLSGIPMVYSAGTADQWPKNLACHLMYGDMWAIGVPDLDRTDLIVAMGANPAASQGSLMAVADAMGHLAAIRDRGGRVVVVDPVRTPTAEAADEWVPIVPGTDAALLMAMTHVLFDEGLVHLGAADGLVDGLDEVRELVADWRPEDVESTCGVPAATIRELARALATTERAVLYGRIGTCTQEFGTLASWLVDVVNILAGNLDREGGLMFSTPALWSVTALPMPELEGGQAIFGRWRSRVSGVPEVLGQVPVSCLAEEIATPGDGQIRALVTVAGNPVLSTPDAGRLDEALPLLEAMVCIDNHLNETTRHADVILPGLSPLEQPHLDDMIWGWAVRSAVKWSDTVVPPADGRPEEWEALVVLAGILAGMGPADIDVDAIDDGYFVALAEMKGADPAVALAGSPGRGPERLADLTIRTGAFGDRYGAEPDGLTLEKVRAAPHGIDLGPMVPRLPGMLTTPDRRIRLAPGHITADLRRLRARLGRAPEQLVLVSRRHLRSNNSWLHNVEVLVKGKDRCTLLMHPDDAATRGIAGGATVEVRSEAGRLEVPVELTDGIRPGVVSLPHGWGHDKEGTRLSVAARHAGVNTNLLSPGRLIDEPSNNAVFNGIPVEVAPAG